MRLRGARQRHPIAARGMGRFCPVLHRAGVAIELALASKRSSLAPERDTRDRGEPRTRVYGRTHDRGLPGSIPIAVEAILVGRHSCRVSFTSHTSLTPFGLT